VALRIAYLVASVRPAPPIASDVNQEMVENACAAQARRAGNRALLEREQQSYLWSFFAAELTTECPENIRPGVRRRRLVPCRVAPPCGMQKFCEIEMEDVRAMAAGRQ